MRLVWTTDIHLNFVDRARIQQWNADVQAAHPDALLISGDIAEATDLLEYLRQLYKDLRLPTYFVLGNHDFYHGSIAETRAHVDCLCRDYPSLHYLTSGRQPVLLDHETALIGHDGWADGRSGEYVTSWVMMNDYRLISELAGSDKRERWRRLQALGDEAAGHVRRLLREALALRRQVILLTHVPPLRAACWHEGQISNDEWAPHFVCVAMGQTILDVMRRHPYHQLLVLCGHTHGGGETRPFHNIRILTGSAEFGNPSINAVFETPYQLSK